MALSKVWTLAKITSVLRVLINEIAPDKVQSLSIVDYVNLATQDLAEMLNGASQPDYGVAEKLAAATEPTAITTLDVYYKAGETKYVVDLASLANSVDKVIKLFDSANGLILPAGDYEFDNIINIPQKQKNVWYIQFGEKIFLLYGTGATQIGTVTLFYYRQPTMVSADGDYVDMKDKYVPLLVAKAKNLIYEQLRMAPPESLTNMIEQKSAEIRKLNLEENVKIEQSKRK